MQNLCRLLLIGVVLSAFAADEPRPSDPNYRALRDAVPADSFAVKALTLQRDIGSIELRSGNLTFLTPVLDRRTMAVFTGDGEFKLTPINGGEPRYLMVATGKENV